MTCFRYTPDMRDTVAKALGDGWEKAVTYWWWTDGISEIDLRFQNGRMVLLVDVGTYRPEEIEPFIVEAKAAEDRLRAAGLEVIGK